jgi:hypothetical protein
VGVFLERGGVERITGFPINTVGASTTPGESPALQQLEGTDTAGGREKERLDIGGAAAYCRAHWSNRKLEFQAQAVFSQVTQ